MYKIFSAESWKLVRLEHLKGFVIFYDKLGKRYPSVLWRCECDDKNLHLLRVEKPTNRLSAYQSGDKSNLAIEKAKATDCTIIHVK